MIVRLKDLNLGRPGTHHYLTLVLILLIGMGLRFWNLDAKPLWLDEVLTALFTMGKSYQDVPLEQFFSLTILDQLFAVRSPITCPQLTQTLITESVHPPLFFCLLHHWLGWLKPNVENWVWLLRSLPALFGVGLIAAIYWLNRIAFSPIAGLLGAALMAVSPFAVYLSQEARHYTLPMLLITLGLTALIKIQQAPRHVTPWLWVAWTAVNMIGLYVHYFCLLALIAQIITIVLWMVYQHQQIIRRHWIALGLSIITIAASFLPWLPIFISHMMRPETDWLIPYKPDWTDRIAPLYQTLVGWVLMVIALPIEDQPDTIAISFAVLGFIFALWLAWQIYRHFQRFWQRPQNHSPTLLLAGFIACVLLQFFAIVYILDKDLTVVPRYNFVYYPAVCALLGAVLAPKEVADRETELREQNSRMVETRQRGIHYSPVPITLLIVGFLSSLLVINNFAFHKSYRPDQVAQDMAFELDKPLSIVVSYRSPQEIALGLSFALALHRQNAPEVGNSQVRYAFVDRTEGYSRVWRQLPQMSQPLPMPLNLWVVASPGMRTKDYPNRLRLANPATPNLKAICLVDPEEFHRIGFPYQLFRCQGRTRG